MSQNNITASPGRFLQFACDCVSRLHNAIRDPWSHVSRAGLISSETKEIILNKTYRGPKTVTQLAKEIGLSQPAIHKHVKELLASDMLRSVSISDEDKKYRVEQYYEPNFPVLLLEDTVALEAVCRRIAERIAKIYWEERGELGQAFASTSLKKRGYAIEDILDYLYSKIRRTGRQVLDEQGFFPELPTHKDGSRWVYWAEEMEDGNSDTSS
ncbi:MAG: winged helix-turn-helix transcriptional regulator [Desulfobacteraceae bacterium]|nr:winged helix-turn-helix transcriptional regulator [Desulfobacteraceae bacterium]